MKPRVVVLTRVPLPGQVKTRLIPALGPQGACRLHEAMVAQTLDRALATELPITISITGPMDHPFVHGLIARGLHVEAQVQGDLGTRLRHALRRPGPQIALGSDCPTFAPYDILEAASAAAPVAIGPTLDGGYWLIMVNTHVARSVVFTDIPWSTDAVCETTRARAEAAQLPIHWLPTRYDVDVPSDLERLYADAQWPQSGPD